MTDLPRIWVLLGLRKGDNNQLLALANGLALPYETRSPRYNVLRRLPKKWLGERLVTVLPKARKWLQPPWPDLVIGIGHRSVPIARYIRNASGGRTKLVQLGNPRLESSHFDLVITMPQYVLPPSDRVVRLPLAMAGPNAIAQATDAERAFFDALPRPHRLMVIGGPNKHWHVDAKDAAAAAQVLMARCDSDGGSLIAIGSPRTERIVEEAVAKSVAGTRHRFVDGGVPRYVCLLQDADEIHVTADSVSMLSEAIFTGKPIGMIAIRPFAKGAIAHALADRGWLRPPRPNLPAFWDNLRREALVGTIDAPRSGEGHDPVQIAVAAVRALLER